MPEGREVPEEVPLDREKGSRGDLRSHKAASVMCVGMSVAAVSDPWWTHGQIWSIGEESRQLWL